VVSSAQRLLAFLRASNPRDRRLSMLVDVPTPWTMPSRSQFQDFGGVILLLLSIAFYNVVPDGFFFVVVYPWALSLSRCDGWILTWSPPGILLSLL